MKTGQSLSKMSKPTALHSEATSQVSEWLNISDTGLARGGIREHDAFLGHEMRGPRGLGVVASRWLGAGKAKVQGRGMG